MTIRFDEARVLTAYFVSVHFQASHRASFVTDFFHHIIFFHHNDAFADW